MLLDTVTNLCDSYEMGTEKMIRKFLRHKSQPLIFLISNSRQCMSGGSCGLVGRLVRLG